MSYQHTIKSLKQKRYHKFIIGAALKDYKYIEIYSYIFTHAGANVIDISAFPHSVISAKKGIQRALEENPNLTEPLIMVSVNTGKDPHFRRIELDVDKCTECKLCIPSCPSDAFSTSKSINKFSYDADLCFGCSNCLSYCPFDALSLTNWSAFDPDSLFNLMAMGASALEIHLNNNLEAFEDFIKRISGIKPFSSPDFLLSFSIGSELMTAKDLEIATLKIVDLIRCKYGSDKEFVIQTDGLPLSGAREMGNIKEKDLSSIVNAKIVLNIIQKLNESGKIFVQLAGGTNEYSLTKAHNMGVMVNGVAIGSYARNLLKKYLSGGDNRDFPWAILEAKKIVNNSIVSVLSS